MNIDRLREFIVLSKTPSFHSAAKKLNVAPSTLSRHIAEMEHELGVILMVRKSTSIKLTHAGYVFLEGICNVVNLYDEVVEKTTEASSVSRHPIIVGGYFVMDGIMKLYNAAVAMAVVEKCPIGDADIFLDCWLYPVASPSRSLRPSIVSYTVLPPSRNAFNLSAE